MTTGQAIETLEEWVKSYGHWMNPVFRDMTAMQKVIEAAKQTSTAPVYSITRTVRDGEREVVMRHEAPTAEEVMRMMGEDVAKPVTIKEAQK